MKIEEKTLDMMERDLEFMERFPNPTYAVLRLSYLVGSEDMENWKKLQEMLRGENTFEPSGRKSRIRQWTLSREKKSR